MSTFEPSKIKDPVLVLEDRKESRENLLNLCHSLGLEGVGVENGALGLELVKKQSFSAYIVDLMMPIMDGPEFISELKKIDTSAIILIQTAVDNPDEIIDIMKSGVFDYIIKPVDPEQFRNSLTKALEYKYLKDQERFMSMNAERKIRSQLEWLVYKEKKRMEGDESQEKNVIYNLKTNLSRGAGLGSITTLIDVIKSSAIKEGEFYKVPSEIIELLYQNNDVTHTTLKGFDTILDILERNFELETVSSEAILSHVSDIFGELEGHISSKNLNCQVPQTSAPGKVNVNPEVLRLVIKELLINALKYSKKNGKVVIMTNVSKGYFSLAIENEYIGEGVPREFEKVVLEPFFTLEPPLGEFGDVEDFSLGLGLTVVDHIIKKHNGMFFIQNIKDHTEKDIRDCVLSEIYLPIVD